jgi:hypothetical protein
MWTADAPRLAAQETSLTMHAGKRRFTTAGRASLALGLPHDNTVTSKSPFTTTVHVPATTYNNVAPSSSAKGDDELRGAEKV